MNDILVYLSIIYKGDWDLIYAHILRKEEVKKEDLNKVLSELKMEYVTLLEDRYPVELKYIFKPPFVLFYKGDYSLLDKSKRRIAVIGSRLNSDYGKEVTERICDDLLKKDNDIVIVSGFAKGIDSIAHKQCIKNNMSTIAVLGNGIDIVYPKANEPLYEDISNKGLFISEYPPSVMPNKDNFPQRNRLIAGLSLGVLVCEANLKSGTMNTVSHALNNGKPIFCIPSVMNPNSGCNKLIKEGAKLVDCAEDILDEL